MKKQARLNLIIFVLIAIFSIGTALAIYAFPGATGSNTVLVSQTCGTETAATNPESFGGACTTTSINTNNAVTQTATVNNNNLYMGVRTSNYNSSVTNCGGITNVKLCYEWWSSSASIGTCTANVDANGGGSYSTASSTCPGTTANPGEICTDVTSLENWTCDNFFTGSGTRSLAYLQVRSTTGGSKTLTIDSLYFNVTYQSDVTAPTISILSPTNTTYASNVTTLNFTATDTNLDKCWYNYNGTNITTSCTSGVQVNVSGLGSNVGSNTWYVYANDTFGYNSSSSVTFSLNPAPTISNISVSPSPSGLNAQLTISANGVNDTNSDSLSLFCSETSSTPTDNSLCSGGGNLTGINSPYYPSCLYYHNRNAGNYSVYCRVYDGLSYSSTVNTTYQVVGESLSTQVISVAGDSSAGYFDTNNDAKTDILVNGSSGMSCRWSSSDLSYSAMSSSCNISGTVANCSVNNVPSEGSYTRYISCQDSYGNSQTASSNLNVDFTLDYTAPTTSTDADTVSIHVPTYEITLTESDNVDSDPMSYYCYSTSPGCSPSTAIDNGGIISLSSSNRGPIYLRYYSVDDAGISQSIVNETININRLPTFTSAVDNAAVILGGTTVTISTISSDLDSSQNLKLYVCSSTGATSSGCTGTQYCSAIATANLSCGFASETDSSAHTWYSYIFDSVGEAATANPLTGSYTTDSTPPVLNVNSPENNSVVSQSSLTFSITSNEILSSATFSLNEESNITLNQISNYTFTYTNNSLPDGDYNITFHALDLLGNIGQSGTYYFEINTSIPDTTEPTVTIISPTNNTFYTDSEILLNITSDENLSWAGYKINSSSVQDLDNISLTSWNTTITLSEGIHNITFYANDTSSNKNQGVRSTLIYVDLTNASANLSCDSQVNDSEDLVCLVNVSDAIGLDYAILSSNFSGTFLNTTIDLNGTSSLFNYSFAEGNYTPGNYDVRLFVYDLSGRVNDTETESVQVLDDTNPSITSIVYSPSNSDALDPNVNVTINASVVEDYIIGSVKVYYRNGTDAWNSSEMTNTSLTSYNSTMEFGEGSWTFYINATDLQGNTNVSSNYTFEVAQDISQNITTNITSIKSFTYAQRSSANLLGYVILNTTSDTPLNYNVTITTNSIQERFNLNNTLNQTENYTASNGSVLFIPVYVNLTGLTSGLYYYNVLVTSEAGTELFERTLNVQTADGPYLVATVSQYSSSVTRGQTDVELVATVTNLGTADASGVVLTWTLPSVFTLTQGNLTRSLGSLPIGVSSTNTIKVSVSSSAVDSLVNITANAVATNSSSLDTKQITIINPLVVTTPGSSSSGGGSGGSGKTDVVYSKTIEVVRGSETIFEIEVFNRYQNKTLKNVNLVLTGFTDKYLEISPKIIEGVSYGEKKYFRIKLTAPSYKEYEEHSLKAVIKATLESYGSSSEYSETQNIRLIIQEVSKENATKMILLAEEAINSMLLSNFESDELQIMLGQAKNYLSDLQNKKAYNLAEEIINSKALAFHVDGLIKEVQQSISNIGDNKFASEAVRQMVSLAISAFERGDYSLAEQRIKSANLMLILERKGNIVLFSYLYWKQIVLSIFLLSLFGIFSFRIYKKKRINTRISDLNVKENKIQKVLGDLQTKYFAGKISSHDYHLNMGSENEELAKLKKERTQLRNKRYRILSGEQLVLSLDSEKREVEKDIKILQERFYVDKKISETEYKTRFELLNDRLAEIESERLTQKLSENSGSVKKEVLNFSTKDFLEKRKIFFKNRKDKREKELKRKIDEILKEAKHRMHDGK
jgi:hypothetical protein